MASQFLKTLPKISINDLPADSKTCIICTDEYNTTPSTDKTAEYPVQLPCLHIIGANCIAKWLTERSNSCPYCRREIFPRALEQDVLEMGDDTIGMGGLDYIDIEENYEYNGLGNYGTSAEHEEFEPRLSEGLTLFVGTLGIIARPGWDEDFPEWDEDPLG